MSSESDNIVANLLKQCGFSAPEQVILGNLFHFGITPVGQLAKRSGLKRPTTYSVLNELVAQGVVTKSIKRGVLHYSAIPVPLFGEFLRDRAQRNLQSIDDSTRELEKLLKISNQRQFELAGFLIETFESPGIVYQKLEEALTAGEGFMGIFDPQKALLGKAKKLVRNYLEKTAVTRPPIRELVIPGPVTNWYLAHIKNPNHQIRYLNPNEDISSDIIILKRGTLISHYGSESENSIRVYHPSLQRTWVSLFERLWKSAES